MYNDRHKSAVSRKQLDDKGTHRRKGAVHNRNNLARPRAHLQPRGIQGMLSVLCATSFGRTGGQFCSGPARISQTFSLLFPRRFAANPSARRRIQASLFCSGCIDLRLRQNLKASSLSPHSDIRPYLYSDLNCAFRTDHCQTVGCWKGKRTSTYHGT